MCSLAKHCVFLYSEGFLTATAKPDLLEEENVPPAQPNDSESCQKRKFVMQWNAPCFICFGSEHSMCIRFFGEILILTDRRSWVCFSICSRICSTSNVVHVTAGFPQSFREIVPKFSSVKNTDARTTVAFVARSRSQILLWKRAKNNMAIIDKSFDRNLT